MITTRLKPGERSLFVGHGDYNRLVPMEPALGTLEERLRILLKRLGGRVGPIRLTRDEQREFLICRMSDDRR